MSKTSACDMCGKPMDYRPTKLSPTRRCHDCRRVKSMRRASYPSSTCAACGQAFKPWKRDRPGECCSRSCASRLKGMRRAAARVEPTSKVRRNDRAMLAPGLNDKARSSLRRSWERAGRTCHYCGGAAETVDHVVPLVRGGTNYEGNLVPACRKCNASKRDLLLVEWRHGKPRGSDGPLREWMSHPRWAKGRKAVTSCQHEPAPAAA